MRIFVGVDCDEHQLAMGFVGSQGILKSLSTTTSLLPDRIDRFGQYLHGMIRGIRGETNLRMKNFRGIGIGLPRSYLEKSRRDIEGQIKQRVDIPVFIEDREVLAIQGRLWLAEVAAKIDPGISEQKPDLSVVYGAAKLALDSAPRNKA